MASLLIFLFTLCAKILNLGKIKYFQTDYQQSINGKETQINYFIKIKLMKLPVDHIQKTYLDLWIPTKYLHCVIHLFQ